MGIWPQLYAIAKILHLITDLNVGGAERMLYRLLSRMDQDAFRSQVVSMTSIGEVGEAIRASRPPPPFHESVVNRPGRAA